MSNVFQFPFRSSAKTTRTPAQWKAELFRAGQAVVEAQMKGEDSGTAAKMYKEIESELPEDVRKELAAGADHSENYMRLLKTGWSFLKELLELKAKMQ
jgi:hypothetical protein